MPFPEILNSQTLPCLGGLQNILITLAGLLPIEQRLKHFYRPLIIFLEKIASSYFLGHAVGGYI